VVNVQALVGVQQLLAVDVAAAAAAAVAVSLKRERMHHPFQHEASQSEDTQSSQIWTNMMLTTHCGKM
jgi:hypothetical protein